MEAKKAKQISMKSVSIRCGDLFDDVFDRISSAANLGSFDLVYNVEDKTLKQKSFLYDFLKMQGYDVYKVSIYDGEDYGAIFISWKNVC